MIPSFRIFVLIALLALAACADKPSPSASGVSAKTLEPVGTVAKDTPFDRIAAESLASAGKEALAQEQPGTAKDQYRQAVEQWPMLRAGWDGLARAASESNDQKAAEFATFFRSRLDWAQANRPMLVARAFDNAAQGYGDVARKNPDIQQFSARMAKFFREQDAQAKSQAAKEEDRSWYYEVAPAATLSLGVFVNVVILTLGNL